MLNIYLINRSLSSFAKDIIILFYFVTCSKQEAIQARYVLHTIFTVKYNYFTPIHSSHTPLSKKLVKL